MYKKHIQNVLIPETSLQVIKEKLNEVNYGVSKGELKLKNVLLIFGFILNEINKAKEEELDRGHLPIHHKKLEKQYSKHYKCTSFLVKNNLLHRFNYSNQGKKCNRYDLHNDYLQDNLVRVNILKPDDTENSSLKTIYEDKSSKKYKHLTDHFKGITIDYTNAKSYIDTQYFSGKITRRKHLVHKSAISKVRNRLFYFRNADTDKRLHTNLTSLPKHLRKFLRYNEKSLVNIDLKNSQPYFLAVIANIILNKDQSTLDKLKHVLKSVKSKKAKKPTNYYKRIAELFDVPFDKKELNQFINSTCEGRFYELLVSKIKPYIKDGDDRLVKTKFNKKLKNVKKEPFGSEREYAKDSSMQIFFASEKSTVKDVTFFKNEFPAIWKLTKYLKGNESSNFAALLQNLEAHLILDKITKEANKQFNAPLFTIHDSIATTKEYVDDIKVLILQVLSETVKLTPKIDVENW